MYDLKFGQECFFPQQTVSVFVAIGSNAPPSAAQPNDGKVSHSHCNVTTLLKAKKSQAKEA